MPIPDKLLHGTRRDYSIELLFERTRHSAPAPALDEAALQRHLLCYTLPSFQRPLVWAESQKRAFIEGVFLGFGCGYHVATAPDWGPDGVPTTTSQWLIDGQQRIGSIAEFVAGSISIFDGQQWGDLTDRQQMNFLREPFPVIEIEPRESQERLLDLYNRLNYGGTPHPPTNQETVQ